MSSEKEQLARQKVIQKKQQQEQAGTQKERGGGVLNAGDVAALQGMVGNTAVGDLGRGSNPVQRSPQDGAQLESASSAAFENIVQRTPSGDAPVIQRKLEGTSAALAEFGEGKINLKGRSSWKLLLNAIRGHESIEKNVANNEQDKKRLLDSLTKVENQAKAWITSNQNKVDELRGRRHVTIQDDIVDNKRVKIKQLSYEKRKKSKNPQREAAKDEQRHLKMSMVQNLLVHIARERQIINESFDAWHQNAAQSDDYMAKNSAWNKDFAVGEQASSLDKVAYNTPNGEQETFYQPDTNETSTGTAGFFTGIPDIDANMTGRALAMMRIDDLLTKTMLKRHLGEAGENVEAPKPPPRKPKGGVALPGMQDGMVPRLPARQGGGNKQAEQPTNMLAKMDIATHTRKDQQGSTATMGFNLENAGSETSKAMRDTAQKGDVIMSNDQRQGNDTDKLSLDDPKLQRSLNKLQLLDVICAQVDRHAGNYFVDVDDQGHVKSVKGIDNDMAFGKDVKKPTDKKDKSNDPVMGQWAWRGLPPIADEEMAKAILSLNAKSIKDAVTGLITDEEVASTISRLEDTQAYIKALPKDALISPGDWEKRRKELAEKQTNENSYLDVARGEAANGIWGKAKKTIEAYLMSKESLKSDQVYGIINGLGFSMPDLIYEQVVTPQALYNEATVATFLDKLVEKMNLDAGDGMSQAKTKAAEAMQDKSIYANL